MTTELQAQKKENDILTNYENIQPTQLNPNNSSTVPTVVNPPNMFQEYMDKYPPVKPPTEENIAKNMWMASGLVGLMAALATGNAATGILAGMYGAITVHDAGYALRTRSKYVAQLQEEGYSYPAILNWYETGDNKELDKEREYMLQKDKFEEEKSEFTQTEGDKLLDREQNARLDRERMANQMNIARVHEVGANARAEVTQQNADRAYKLQVDSDNRSNQRLDMQDRRQMQSAVKDTIKGAQQKQYYMQMADKALGQLKKYKESGNKAGAAEAYHNVRNNLARASVGGNATLTPEQIEQSTGLPSFYDSKANDYGLKVNGMPSDMFISATNQQIQDDIKNEREVIKKQGVEFYQSLIAEGRSPEEAAEAVTHVMIGTAIGPQDWSQPDVAPSSPHAPAKAIAYLVAHPDEETKKQFEAKYGYLPEGI
jgi:hypothetical protein